MECGEIGDRDAQGKRRAGLLDPAELAQCRGQPPMGQGIVRAGDQQSPRGRYGRKWIRALNFSSTNLADAAPLAGLTELGRACVYSGRMAEGRQFLERAERLKPTRSRCSFAVAPSPPALRRRSAITPSEPPVSPSTRSFTAAPMRALVAIKHRRLARRDDVLGAAHRRRRVCRHDLAGDQPVEQHAHGGELLLDAGR